ncbi:hypothetical protein A2U01_0062038, partial [Trifolium medium]|nr:hypothetical protein [Trifolium medium]
VTPVNLFSGRWGNGEIGSVPFDICRAR